MSAVILRLPEVCRRTGLKKTQIYLIERRGEFPTHLKLGVRASGWLEAEVESWIQARAATRGDSQPE